MSNFTQLEIEYMQGQRLGRLATVNEAGDPHVVPVSFRYNTELDTIDIGGHNLSKSKKFRDAARHGRVAFVIDDVLPPWKPRGVEIRGRSETHETGGHALNPDFDAEVIRLFPERIVGWGLDTDAFKPNSRLVK